MPGTDCPAVSEKPQSLPHPPLFPLARVLALPAHSWAELGVGWDKTKKRVKYVVQAFELIRCPFPTSNTSEPRPAPSSAPWNNLKPHAWARVPGKQEGDGDF